MSRRTSTIPAKYFDDQYRANIDPWRFRSSPYEKEKYAATLAALSKRTYRSALEVGCSIGVLTAELAPRCDRLLAIDASETAVAEAKLHNAGLTNVDLQVAALPDQFPDGPYDLIMLSEVLYYFAPDDLRRVAGQCLSALTLDGDIILCHWLGETDYPLPGQEASEIFAQAVTAQLSDRAILHDDVYRLERWSGKRDRGEAHAK